MALRAWAGGGSIVATEDRKEAVISPGKSKGKQPSVAQRGTPAVCFLDHWFTRSCVAAVCWFPASPTGESLTLSCAAFAFNSPRMLTWTRPRGQPSQGAATSAEKGARRMLAVAFPVTQPRLLWTEEQESGSGRSALSRSLHRCGGETGTNPAQRTATCLRPCRPAPRA